MTKIDVMMGTFARSIHVRQVKGVKLLQSNAVTMKLVTLVMDLARMLTQCDLVSQS